MQTRTGWTITSVGIAALVAVLTATPAIATPITAADQPSSWATGRSNSAHAISTYPTSPALGDGHGRLEAPTPATGDEHGGLQPNPAFGDGF
jgi:hypothetical protein